MLTSRCLVAAFMALSTVALAQSDLIPFPGCFFIEMAFKSLGCANSSGGGDASEYCEYLSLALRLQLENGEGLCSSFPCTGYGTTGRKCTSLFPRACSSSDRISNGICSVGKECCED